MEQLTSSRFSDEPQTIEEYAPFSFLSVLVFVLALVFATISLVNYVLVLLALVGVILSVLMLFRLHSVSSPPQPFMFACAALAVSLIGFAFPITYQSLRYRHLEKVAVEHSQTWLDLVKNGKTLEAYELSLQKDERQPPGTDLKMIHGRVDDPTEDLQEYLDMQPEKSLRELGPDAELTLEKVEYHRRHNRHDMFEVHYRLHRTEWERDDYVFAMLMERIHPFAPLDVYWEFRKMVPIRPKFARGVRKIGVAAGQERELVD